jgi:predicted NBD/HSP70 family sugar kinase
MKPLWGIDLGGTKIEGVILSSSDSTKSLCRTRIPTEAYQGYEHIISRICLIVEDMQKATGIQPETLGIGTPGTLDPDLNAIKNSNTTCLNGKPFKDDLEKALGIPIKIANDANCFALAETRLGVVAEKLPGAEVVFGIILGTGVGGGVVVHGKLINGRHGIGGEWGHNFLDASGGDCYCGLSGCVETVLSGTGLQKYYYELSGEPRKLKFIYQRYLECIDPDATATIDRLLIYFGKAIANVINIIDPDAIVLGGGVGNIDLLYSRGVQEATKYVFNPKLNTAFFKPKLGDSAGVFGAAMLVA